MSSPSDPRDVRIAQLEQLLRAALERIDGLVAEVGALTRENAELKARLGKNSGNSSKPPSSDGPEVKRPVKKPTGLKRGGQAGHEGAERKLLPADQIVHHRPRRCRNCEHPLAGNDPDPKVFQVLELPEVRAHVTEHRAHSLACGQCGTVTSEQLPADVLQHGFGPRLSGFVAYLTGRCRLSKRQVVEFLADAMGTPMSLGAVCAVEQDVSAALAAPVEEARAAVRTQSVAHADETGWREEKQRAWLWTVVTAIAIVFTISRSRGAAVAKEMLGANFAGRLVTDRWSAYNWLDVQQRQVCWAHLLRDFQGMVDRGGTGALSATAILAEAGKMMRWWHDLRDGLIQRRTFQRKMVGVRAEVSQLLRDAVAYAEPKTAGMCAEIQKLESALWTFVDVEGLEPTNNAAERAIRPAVLWRKGCFGNDSAKGSRFTERILTTVATVRLRGGNVLRYLTQACADHRTRGSAPSLLALTP